MITLLIILLVLSNIISGGFCAYVGTDKNRDGINWFFLGFFFGVIALVALIGLSTIPKETYEQNQPSAPFEMGEMDESKLNLREIGR